MNNDLKAAAIQCLVFDDHQDDAVRFIDALSRSWAAARANVPHLPELNANWVTSDTVANERLNHAEKLDIFVCDIFVRDLMIGFELIAKAKQVAKVPLVVAISKGPDAANVDVFDQYREETGQQDEYVPKKLFQVNAQRITEKWIGLLEARGRLRFRGEVLREPSYQDDPALEYVWEHITPETVSAIGAYFCTDQTTDKMYVAPIDAGKSGAIVFKVRFSGHVAHGTTRGVLLKLSRDFDSLHHEYLLYQQEFAPNCRLGTHLVVQLLLKKAQPFEANGWYALGSEFVTNSTTLVSWLTNDCGTTEAATDILQALFLKDALSACYRRSRNVIERDPFTAFAMSTLTPLRRSRVSRALRELLPLIKKYSPGTWPLPTLHYFLANQMRVGCVARNELTQECVFAVQHGDLHGRNVLVETNGPIIRPRIIDYATAENMPWPTDTVRLIVDLLLSCLSPGAGGYEWHAFAEWLELGNLLSGGEMPDLAKNQTLKDEETLIAALLWMFQNRFEIASVDESPKHNAEYLLALAIELMRASYRETVITAPKRTLALALSEKCFRQAESAFSAIRDRRI